MGRPKPRQFLREANAGNTRRGWDCRVGKPLPALISVLSSSREEASIRASAVGSRSSAGKPTPRSPPPLSIFFLSYAFFLSLWSLISVTLPFFFSPFLVRLFCVCLCVCVSLGVAADACKCACRLFGCLCLFMLVRFVFFGRGRWVGGGLYCAPRSSSCPFRKG